MPLVVVLLVLVLEIKTMNLLVYIMFQITLLKQDLLLRLGLKAMTMEIYLIINTNFRNMI